MNNREGVVLRTAMYIAYANEIVRYAADMMGPVEAGTSEEIRAMGRELHVLMEKVRSTSS